MAVEIERKFLVTSLPSAGDLGPGVHLRQGYLAEEGDVEVRLRITDTSARLTTKAGKGMARVEVDLELARDDAEALWPYTEGRRIDKVRHRVPIGDVVAELDVYAGSLDGLVVVEVEFESPAAAAAFAPPGWFGAELTGEAGWSNASLARHGRPPGG